MSPVELRAVSSLAALFGLRMLGLFIVLPVLAVFASTLGGGGDRSLVGLAFGAYGLTQALLQIPFGWLSDRWGRRPLLYGGLALFAAGSFVCALAGDIHTMIAGRVLQGAGAISGVAIAMVADLTRPEVRTRAMGLVGATIGLAFLLSLIAGPLLTGVIGVPGLFHLTGLLALAAIVVVRFAVPAHARAQNHARAQDEPPIDAPRLARVLGERELLRLDYGIFALHAVLVMIFLEVPHALERLGLPVAQHWQVYLPVVVLSLVLMLPAMLQADRPERAKGILAGGIAALLASQILLHTAAASMPGIIIGLTVFFTAVNLLEAKLPSLVSKMAPAEVKGTAVGVYSSIQFLGVFFGGAVGGVLQQHHGVAGLFWFGVVLTGGWLVLAISMPSLATYNYSLAKVD